MTKCLIIWIINILLIIMCFILQKKINLKSTFIMIIFITFFSLLNTCGKVLFTIFSFKITEESLLAGLYKSGMLSLFLFLSKLIVGMKPPFPGKIGKFIKNVFYFFNCFTQVKINIKNSSLIDSLDKCFIDVWEEKAENEKEKSDI